MHTGLEDRASSYPALAEYFAERARGGAALMITGGIAPNVAGWVSPFAGKLSSEREVERHQLVTSAVREANPRSQIIMQILHAGRYGYHPFVVAPTRIKSPISYFSPWELSQRGVERQIDAFVRCARLAQKAGYAGVEVMGSEGYLINEFLSPKTNKRRDQWGGSADNRARFATEIVRRMREATGPEFIIMYRVSLLDLVEGGQEWAEVEDLARKIEAAGATLFNSGIGWHEARIPTIASNVPRATFTWVTKRLKEAVDLPVIAVNRINMPDTAERILEDGEADLVSLARPLLADPDWPKKAEAGLSKEINVCIACNQGCLDHTFKAQRATCLVNPRACYELELKKTEAETPRKVGVVGGGPAGMACAVEAAERNHQVTLFEASGTLGGQFNLAKLVPGKEEFAYSLDYYSEMLRKLKVDVRMSTKAQMSDLGDFDDVVVATGVTPRRVSIPGGDAFPDKMIPYDKVLSGEREVGKRVAIVGAGGIGFDVAEFLLHAPGDQSTTDPKAFSDRWGIDQEYKGAGGLKAAIVPEAPRQVFLLQRKEGKLGKRLGKTTGWIHRTSLKQSGVEFISGATYKQVTEDGLLIERKGSERLLEVDSIVLCAGQESERGLFDELKAAGTRVHLIGGAEKAAEIDAKRAIREGVKVAMKI